MAKNCIGVYTPYLGGYYFGGILEGIHSVARQHGIHLIAIQGNVQKYPSRLAWDQVDGWIVVFETKGIERLAERNFPVVTVSIQAIAQGYPAVIADNHSGTLAVTRHLLDHGHQRIAFVGPLENGDVQERYTAYKAALAERGIAFDPAIVFDNGLDAPQRIGGSRAAQWLLEAGMPCTAVVTAGDEIAIGMMEGIQAAGYHIPEDVALVGFDDTAMSQYTNPSLTTVRQRPSTLGEKAAQLLLAQIEGQAVPGGIHYVPTTLVQRRSCGCRQERTGLVDTADYTQPGWQDSLAYDLIRQVRFPHPVESDKTPAEIWPGVISLIQGLADAAEGVTPASVAPMDQAWREAIALISDIEGIHAVYKLLRSAGLQHIAARPGDSHARIRIEAYLDHASVSMLRAYVLNETSRNTHIEQLLRTSYEISALLVSETFGNLLKLGWLEQTPMSWGCLGCWAESHRDGAALVVSGAYNGSDRPIPFEQRYLGPAFPPVELLPPATFHGETDIAALLPIRQAGQDWGVLALGGPIESHLPNGIETMGTVAALLSAALEREQLLNSLASQQDALRELGSPTIPLLPGVLLMPLVGAIDERRAQQIIETLLHEVSAQSANVVLLDITGVPLVDTQVANSLLSATKAVMLLGAKVVMVGVRPEIAQSIVGLGIDLRSIATPPTLAAALRSLYRSNRALF